MKGQDPLSYSATCEHTNKLYYCNSFKKRTKKLRDKGNATFWCQIKLKCSKEKN